MTETASEAAGNAPPATRRLLYWEDLKEASARSYGPVVFSSELLDQLLNLLGEKHPIHDSGAFAESVDRRQRIIPGGFIHAITSGWVVRHGSAGAVLGLRSMNWDYVRPLYPDTPFWFTTETEHSELIDDRCGLVRTVRRVHTEDDRVYAIGRLSVVFMRRSWRDTRVEERTRAKAGQRQKGVSS
ncbi:MaoC family dehydratase [Streptomyces geranii]|uniref:MaoC family dehydratase n=1 Tax=Streptomyces geranii TaxID=2058923 RepID=UPI000D043FA1|nr:MaoC family dehydratase [Streptomyces geranii]